MNAAGALSHYDDDGPAGMAKCILFRAGTLISLGAYGGIASVVVITLDRFWKIVYPIHHRKYYRPWMLKVGLFLPWLNGVAVDLLPAAATSRIINGKCYPLLFWPSVLMRKVRLLRCRVDWSVPIFHLLTINSYSDKLAFHGADTDTDTDTDILTTNLAMMSDRMSACSASSRSACHRNNFRKSIARVDVSARILARM